MDRKRKFPGCNSPISYGVAQAASEAPEDGRIRPSGSSQSYDSPPGIDGHDAYSGHWVGTDQETASTKAKRIKPESYDTDHGCVVTSGSDGESAFSASQPASPSGSDATDSISPQKCQALLPALRRLPDDFTDIPTAGASRRQSRKMRKTRYSDEEDQKYVDDQEGDDGEIDPEYSDEIDKSERDDIVYILSREKAKRMVQAVKVPKDTKMGEEERCLYLDLATRGCKPMMPADWKKDFTTLPESLFPAEDDEVDENDFTFKIQKGSNFYAITALHGILQVPGHVRDCRVLTVLPQTVIAKAIRKYLRWAISDAGLKIAPQTVPVYTIYAQKRDEDTLSVVNKVIKKLEKLSASHQTLHRCAEHQYWPTLVGFCLCGPIVTILSVDTNPESATWTNPAISRAKYMGQFDMSEDDQDVWNSLALAIAVIHIRQAMGRLADTYDFPFLPRWREEGGAVDSGDEDL
ncbi:uncharacterized protein N7482_007001 [Penicillium canariense]|uniref:Uncharacterized protein n=1 Tax=Penicillium canariense TaxID=189055 RepID=A0A9W9HVZ5_9EURO|nr:uncharacterized protein N7482_007001 [Penicillium canariense]KAJ5159997.1 hypothetical protein N7482_007001 [Penicillium canariense]